MKDYLELIGLMTLFVAIIAALLGLVYSLIAGVWGFNPTEIPYFNFKLFVTCFVAAIISASIAKQVSK